VLLLRKNFNNSLILVLEEISASIIRNEYYCVVTKVKKHYDRMSKKIAQC